MNSLELQRAIDNKWVCVNKHPYADLYIYNYTPQVQYERLWNDITLQCRGLITDNELNIVARPFPKFFNMEEVNEVPTETFEVFEKMDGSLGILYWLNNIPYIATRGSFTSEQALHATNLLHTKYKDLINKLDRTSTYLFEIIYPQNKIVVNYGSLDVLVLLTVINIETGEERLDDIGFPIVKRYDGVNDFHKLKQLNLDNKEGFVIKFKNNYRLKIKFQEYVRLHRILTNISNVIIWEYMSEEKPFEDLLQNVPDEFYDWVKKTQSELSRAYNDVLIECLSSFKKFETRKETAEYMKTQKYPHILFLMLDNKSVNNSIWKLIKPTYSKPYYEENILN